MSVMCSKPVDPAQIHKGPEFRDVLDDALATLTFLESPTR